MNEKNNFNASKDRPKEIRSKFSIRQSVESIVVVLAIVQLCIVLTAIEVDTVSHHVTSSSCLEIISRIVICLIPRLLGRRGVSSSNCGHFFNLIRILAIDLELLVVLGLKVLNQGEKLLF